MLLNRNPECRFLLEDIRAIPDSGQLADHVENYEFKKAVSALKKLRENYV